MHLPPHLSRADVAPRIPAALLALFASLAVSGCYTQERESLPLNPLPDSSITAGYTPALQFGTAALPVPLPDAVLPTLAGDTLRLSSYRGKTLLLSYWATWCPPCRLQISDLNRLHAELQGEELVIIGITVEEDTATVRAFVESFGVQYPIVFDSGILSDALGGVYGLPASFIVTPEGQVAERIVGALPPERIRTRVAAVHHTPFAP